MTYCVFTRNARNFEEFVKARKVVLRRGLSYSEAMEFCAAYNRDLTPAQIRRGHKAEFRRE